MAVLALVGEIFDDNTPIICNGFKDDEFIEAVILATKIGKNIIPVVEKFSELELIVKYAKLHNVKPSIGGARETARRQRVGQAGSNPVVSAASSACSSPKSLMLWSTSAKTAWAIA